MKKIIQYASLVIALAILSFTIMPTIKVIHFYGNQEAIEAEFCENIDKPEMNCHGKCHLKKQLQINYQVEASNSSQYKMKSIFVFQTFDRLDIISFYQELYSNQNLSFFQDFRSDKHTSNLLDPPEVLFA